MERLGEGRLGWQSKLLVWICVPVALYALLDKTALILDQADHFGFWQSPHPYLVSALLLSIFFTCVAAFSRAATVTASITGGILCYIAIDATALDFFDAAHGYHANFVTALTSVSVKSALPALVVLFVLTFAATRWRRGRKQTLGIAEPRKGRRTSQIVANLAVGCLFREVIHGGRFISFSTIGWHIPRLFDQNWHYTLYFLSFYSAAPILAALAEATADTVSSEVGQGFGGRTWMLTTLKPVEVGVDGGVSLMGTLAGLVGAALVVVTGAVAMGLGWKLAGIAFAGAVVGLFFDSLMGATVERWGWVNNDVVNFSSTLVSALVAGVILLL